MNKFLIPFLSLYLLTCDSPERVWDNPYDPNWEIDRSILILPLEQTIDISEEIVLDVQFNIYPNSIFAVSMVIDYDSTIIQPINFANGEVFGTENISFFTAEDSKIFLTTTSHPREHFYTKQFQLLVRLYQEHMANGLMKIILRIILTACFNRYTIIHI